MKQNNILTMNEICKTRIGMPRCFVVLMLFAATAAAQQTGDIKDSVIQTGRFYDSSHHWYDINDEDRIITPLKEQKRYSPDQTESICENILLFQKTNGGWAKNYDMLAILTKEQSAAVKNVQSVLNTTFDNGATHSQMLYLAEAYKKIPNEKCKQAILRGLDFILSAQYPNGGFPQFYPDTSGYRKHITFNDGAMIGVMNILKLIAENSPLFEFLDQERRIYLTNAYQKSVACILKTQIVENGVQTVWCQQHDCQTLQPRPARTFEPAAICNGESAEIVLFLMTIPHPDSSVVSAVTNAVQWFEKSKIFNTRIDTVPAEEVRFMYHTSRIDKVVTQAADAPPIWTRFYELGSHRPLFCNRDRIPVYSLAEVERERRTGYGWYTYAPQEVLDEFPKWLERVNQEMQER